MTHANTGSVFAAPPATVDVDGFALGQWGPLADIFARAVADQGEGGAALAVFHDGGLVVDLWGGDYASDTVQLLFSATKPVSAVVAAVAHAAGELDLDSPLSTWWPEFARSETAAITVRDVLSHRSGLASMDVPLTFEQILSGDADAAIGRQTPYWAPGTAHGYHSFTFGLLLDGVFRRALGISVGEYLATRIVDPMGLDVWIGIDPSQLHRVATTRVRPQWTTPLRAEFARLSTIPPGASQRLRKVDDFVNDPRLLQACWPALSGTATARSLAQLMAMTAGPVGGHRVLEEPAASDMTALRSRGPDRVLGIETAFGTGVQRPFPQLPMLGSQSYGHEGANGCVVVVAPHLGLSVAIVTNVFPAVSGMSMRFSPILAAIRMLAGD